MADRDTTTPADAPVTCDCDFTHFRWHDTLLRIEDDMRAVALLLEAIECPDGADSPDGQDDIPTFVSSHNWRDPAGVTAVAERIRDAREFRREALRTQRGATVEP